jgi:hypothetical protein
MMIRRHLMSCLVVPVCLVSSSALAAPPPDYKGRPFTDEFHKAGPPAIPEWTNYTVDVKEPGTYSIKALYSHMATAVSFDLNGKPAATGQVPRATESWHHWDYGPIGTITFPEAGLQLLTFHYGRGNNWAFWVFEKIGSAAPAPATDAARK